MKRAGRIQALAAIDLAFSTHSGFGRTGNQDAFCIYDNIAGSDRMGRLLVIGDGMGGHNGGAYASRFACNALSVYYGDQRQLKKTRNRVHEMTRRLTELIFRIDRNLRLQALKDPKLEDMGTTLSCLLITGRQTIIAHVGDSRIYRMRYGHLSCLTRDHTFVQDMILEGELTPQKALHHPLRHMLTQAMGAGEPLEVVQTRSDPIVDGDRFLLCTDGLYNTVDDERIAVQLNRRCSAKEIAHGLLREAVINRARDDATAIVVKIHSPAVPFLEQPQRARCDRDT